MVYLPTATWDYAQVTDSLSTSVAAWSLADHGSIEVDTDWPDVPWAVEGPDGNHYIWRNPGGIVWSALFYLPTNLNAEPSRMTEVPHAPATLSAVVATSLGIGAMVLLLTRVVRRRTAFWAGLALGLATSNWSISADAPWNHGPTLLFLTLGMFAVAREKLAWSGLSFAAAITVRPHLAVAPAVLGLAESWRKRRLAPALVIGVTSLIGLVAVLWFYDHFFGSPNLRPEQTAAFFSGDVNLTDHGWLMNSFLWLFHPARGLFVFSPFLLLLLPALPAAWRSAPYWVRSAAVGAVLYAIIQTRADVFHAGFGFFGYRGPLETLTLTWPLLAIAFEQRISSVRPWRNCVIALTLASTLVFAAGSSVLDPRTLTPHMYCATKSFVAHYRPDDEVISAELYDQLVCRGLELGDLSPGLREHYDAGLRPEVP